MTDIRKYQVFQSFGEISVDITVDHDILTPELAEEINEFWGGAEDRVVAADGDVVMAVAKLIASRFMALLLESDSIPWAQGQLDSSEGYPPNGGHGVKLIDFDGLPEISSEDLIIEPTP